MSGINVSPRERLSDTLLGLGWWAGDDGEVVSDFAGETARLYARFRRDLPVDQAGALAASLGLVETDVVVDLGCGTGQLTLPLRRHCAGVVAVDPEAGMLADLRARQVPGVVCVLGDDGDLPALGSLLGRGPLAPGAGTGSGSGGAGAVVVGNALHWMDERSALSGAAALLRAGGGLAVVTQGPPLWLGSSPWQQAVREVLERGRGRSRQTCGSDDAALDARAQVMADLGLEVTVDRWQADHAVDVEWVLGHLGSAMSAGALSGEAPDGLGRRLRAALADVDPAAMVEHVTTTALIGRRPG